MSSLLASKKNEKVKKIIFIRDNPLALENKIFVEGRKHIEDFLMSRLFVLEELFLSDQKEKDCLFSQYSAQTTFLTEKLCQYFSLVDSHQGVFGIFIALYDTYDYTSINPKKPTFILDGVSDPGNMGTLIRTAGALGREYIICLGGCIPFNQKVIRASAGVLSRVKVILFKDYYEVTLSKILQSQSLLMDMSGRQIVLDESDSWRDYFVVLGSEGKGISEEVKSQVTRSLSLPMAAEVESLNVSVVGGIVGYVLWGLKK